MKCSPDLITKLRAFVTNNVVKRLPQCHRMRWYLAVTVGYVIIKHTFLLRTLLLNGRDYRNGIHVVA